MNSELIEEIYSLLHRHRGSTDQFFLQSNNFLSLSKPTDENLIDYLTNLKANKLPTYLLYSVVLSKFAKLLIHIFLQFFPFPAKPDSDKVSNLFVSHYFDKNEFKDVDNFFGFLPGTERVNHYEINYIDQTKTSFFSQRIYVKKKSLYLIGLTTLNFRTIRLIFNNLKTSFGLLKKRNSEDSNLGKLFLLKASLSQVGGSTLRNQILAIEIARSIRIRDVQNLWMTFEGHGFERSIIAYLRNQLQTVSIHLYQHAPIVKAQVGLFQLIEDFKNTIHIHTSGEITFDFITNKFRNDKLQISVLGSSKSHVSNLLPNNDNTKKESLLFLPEGTLDAFYEMAILATDLRSKYNGQIVFRPHPNLSTAHYNHIALKLERSGVELSFKAIEKDFRRSLYCIYRSSSAAIESLKFGVLPISYQSISQIDLDCLALKDLRYPKFQSVDELIDLLDSLKSNSSSSYFSSNFEFQNYADRYFVRMKSHF